MLFDLEDYRVWGIIGPSSISQENINWTEAYQTFKHTFSNYGNAIKSYIDSSIRQAKMSDRLTLLNDEEQIWIKYAAFGRISKTLWHALISKPVQFNEGDKFYVYDSYEGDDRFPGSVVYPKLAIPSYQWYNQVAPKRAIASTNEFYDTNWDPNFVYDYTPLTQAIFTSYKTALVELQAAVKQFITDADGEIVDYVAPAIPAWNEYPELSGYVKGNNYLAIQGAIVNLVDAQGTVHSVVTDSKGYYKFSKEFIYNNIALDSTEIGSFQDFNMYISEETESGVVLYDSTNKYQSSFFGSANNRGLEWPVRLKMNKECRQNFRLEVLPDYSNYPSFKGQVLDANGNPVQNALVMIRNDYAGTAIGNYVKITNGNWNYKFKFKYNDFGVTKSVLTDENGYYEYTSQMVGEWFNNPSTINDLGVLPNSLTDPRFGYNDGTRDHMTNEFNVIAWPWPQDPESDSIQDVGTPFYDPTDYFATRFQYAYAQGQSPTIFETINMGQEYTFDINAYTVNPEAGAEKLYISPKLYAYTNLQFYITTTTGYFRIKKWDGTYRLIGSDSMQNQEAYCSIYVEDGNLETVRNVYIYSCDQYGMASGHITSFNIDSINFDSIGLTELTGITDLIIGNNNLIKEIDLTGLNSLTNIHIHDCYNRVLLNGLENLTSLTSLTLEGKLVTEFSRSNTDFIHDVYAEGWSYGNNPIGMNSSVSDSIKLSDGSIIIVGNFDGQYNYNGNVIYSNKIAKLNSDLTIDQNFASAIETGFNSLANLITIQPDGKLLVSGYFSQFNGQSKNMIARLNSDGTLDTSFDFSSSYYGEIRKIKCLDNGKILIAGNLNIDGESKPLVMLNSDGSVDTNTPINLSLNNFADGIYDSTIFDFDFQSNGKIIIVGVLEYDNNGTSVYGVARLNSDFTLDTSFDNTFRYMSTNRVKVQPDDKIILVGGYNQYYSINCIYRLNSDGTQDTEFNNNISNINGNAMAIHLYEDGSILLGGWFRSLYGQSADDNPNYQEKFYSLFIANPDGTLKSNDFGISRYPSVYGFMVEGNDIIVYGDINQDVYINNDYYYPYNIYKYIRVGAPISQLSLPSSIEYLSIGNNYYPKSIDLTGLTNLNSLEISGLLNLETLDISGLSNIHQLTIYDSGEVEDFNVLANGTDLSNLTSFNIYYIGKYSNGRIVNISELDFSNTPNLFNVGIFQYNSNTVLNNSINLVNSGLVRLNMHGTPIENLDLTGCNALRELTITQSSTNVDLSILGSGSSLYSLVLEELSGNVTLPDFSVLSLDYLRLYGINGATSISVDCNTLTTAIISYIPSLTSLNINGSSLTNIQIENLFNLADLDLSVNNQSPLALKLWHTNLSSLDLSNLPGLKFFNFVDIGTVNSINVNGLNNLTNIYAFAGIPTGILDLTQTPNVTYLEFYDNFSNEYTAIYQALVTNGKTNGTLIGYGANIQYGEGIDAKNTLRNNRGWVIYG